MPSNKTTVTTKVLKTPEKKMKVTTPKAPVKKVKKNEKPDEAVLEPVKLVLEPVESVVAPVVQEEASQTMVQSRKKTPYNFYVSQQMKKLGSMPEWKEQKKSDLMKECGNLWKTMNDKEKAVFSKMAEEQEVVMKPIKNKKVKKLKKEKQDKPKKARAKTPYNFFVSEQMKKLNATSEWKEKKNSELMKECGSMWKGLNDKEKEPYQKQADVFKEKLELEKKLEA